MSDDILKVAREAYKAASEADSHNRDAYREDVQFARLGKQWPDKIREERERDGRPCLTINRMPAFARQVINDARRNTPQINVSAVDSGADRQTAEILGGMIRHIERNSCADIAYDTAIENAVYGGFGFWSIDTDYASDDGFEQELFIRRENNPLAIFGDPDSESATSEDWKLAIKLHTLSPSQFKAKYGKADPVSFEAEEIDKKASEDRNVIQLARYWEVSQESRSLVLLSNGGTMFEDELQGPKGELAMSQGIMPTEQRRKIAQSKVRYYILSGAEVLEQGEWAGKYIPIVPVYGEELFFDGKRYFRSLIRDAKDAQQQLNYWRTTSTELVALAPKAPFIGARGAFKSDAKKWNTANSRNWSFIEYDPVPNASPPQRQPFEGPPAGALQEALNASDDMKAIMGLHDASLGARGNETSGIAIRARQMEGDTSNFHFPDNRNRSIEHTGRILVDLIPKVYGPDRVVRVLGLDGESRQVTVNTQVQDETGAVKRIYDLGAGRYDVAVKAGPSFATQREEAAAQMTEMFRAVPESAIVLGDLWAKMQDWPFAEEVEKRLQGLQQQQAQASQPQAAPQDPNKAVDYQIKLVDLEIERTRLQIEQAKAGAATAQARADHASAIASALAPPQPPQAA